AQPAALSAQPRRAELPAPARRLRPISGERLSPDNRSRPFPPVRRSALLPPMEEGDESHLHGAGHVEIAVAAIRDPLDARAGEGAGAGCAFVAAGAADNLRLAVGEGGHSVLHDGAA